MRRFLASPNRTRFALAQAVVADPGTAYHYSDITADITTGILEYASNRSALELAEEALFRPMDFRNYEWMHQDRTGIDSGSYGLRLRAIDLQKLGILYLQRGVWDGRRLLSSDWTERSFSPYIRTSKTAAQPDFGWSWRMTDYGTRTSRDAAPGARSWVAHMSTGWKGQRIAVFPDQAIVVTMTGYLEPPEDEAVVFRRVVRDHVIPSLEGTGAAPPRPDPAQRGPLRELLERARSGPMPANMVDHPDAVPSVRPKGKPHHRFHRD